MDLNFEKNVTIDSSQKDVEIPASAHIKKFNLRIKCQDNNYENYKTLHFLPIETVDKS